MLKRTVLSVVMACGLVLMFASFAMADNPAPGYEVIGRFGPTNLPPGGEGVLLLYVYNLGGTQGSEGPTVTDTLPPGLEAISEAISETVPGEPEQIILSPGCSKGTVFTCPMTPIEVGGRPAVLKIPVRVSADPSSGPDRVTVSGGGALNVANATVPVHYGREPAPFSLVNADAWVTNLDGTIDTQAGSHPYEITVAFATTSTGFGSGLETPSGGEPRFMNVSLPPGIVGEPGAVPKCTRVELENEGQCRTDSEIGEDTASITGAEVGFTFPVFNMVPPPGIAAEFAFTFDGNINVFIDARVRSGGDYGITEHANVPEDKIVFNSTTIWGIPGEHATSDNQGYGESVTEHEASVGLKPLLSLPTACGGPVREPGEDKFSFEEDGAWQNESLHSAPFEVPWHNSENAPVGITGCEKLKHFTPFIKLAPDTSFSAWIHRVD